MEGYEPESLSGQLYCRCIHLEIYHERGTTSNTASTTRTAGRHSSPSLRRYASSCGPCSCASSCGRALSLYPDVEWGPVAQHRRAKLNLHQFTGISGLQAARQLHGKQGGIRLENCPLTATSRPTTSNTSVSICATPFPAWSAIRAWSS